MSSERFHYDPKRAARADRSEAAHEASEPKTVAPAQRILLVEDEPHAAGMLALGLREAGFRVDVAREADEAWRLLAGEPYNLLLLDVMLPGRDGFSLCRQARVAGIGVPIIMLTARDTLDDRIGGIDLGADDYVRCSAGRTLNIARNCM
jgi:CheY-like chemotaxis protein